MSGFSNLLSLHRGTHLDQHEAKMDVDLDVLRLRSQFYAQRGGASNRMQGVLLPSFVADLLKEFFFVHT